MGKLQKRPGPGDLSGVGGGGGVQWESEAAEPTGSGPGEESVHRDGGRWGARNGRPEGGDSRVRGPGVSVGPRKSLRLVSGTSASDAGSHPAEGPCPLSRLGCTRVADVVPPQPGQALVLRLGLHPNTAHAASYGINTHPHPPGPARRQASPDICLGLSAEDVRPERRSLGDCSNLKCAVV